MDRRHFLLNACALCTALHPASAQDFRRIARSGEVIDLEAHQRRLQDMLRSTGLVRSCDFAPPAGAQAVGGIVPQSYTLKGGSRGRSQLTWSFTGSITGVGNPLEEIRIACDRWASATRGLTFRRVSGEADIVMRVGPLAGTIIGSTTSDGRSITFDNRPTTTWTPVSFREVATHEVGHAIGLLHATTSDSIMFPSTGGLTALSRDDIAAVRALYGWSEQFPLSDRGSEQAPSLCACGDTLAMAWRGVGRDSDIWFSTRTAGTDWSPQRKIPGAATAAGPSLAWDGTRLWMAWRGVDGDTDLHWTNTTDLFRTSPTINRLGDRASSHGPRIAIVGGVPVMAWKGVPGDTSLYWARNLGGTWEPQKQIGGTGSTAAPAICQDLDPTAVRLAWRGIAGDNALYTTQITGLFPQPQQRISWIVPGNSQTGTVAVETPGSAEGPSLVRLTDRIVMIWRGVESDTGLYFTQFAEDCVGGGTATSCTGSPVRQWSSQAPIPNRASSHSPAIAEFDGSLHAVWKGIPGDTGLWGSVL